MQFRRIIWRQNDVTKKAGLENKKQGPSHTFRIAHLGSKPIYIKLENGQLQKVLGKCNSF
jgi:hypothetical protein